MTKISSILWGGGLRQRVIRYKFYLKFFNKLFPQIFLINYFYLISYNDFILILANLDTRHQNLW